MNSATAIHAAGVAGGLAACYLIFLAYLNPDNVWIWSSLWSICQ